MDPAYCTDFNTYHRRKTNQVSIGDIPMGSEYPVRIQSMTTTPTSDIGATVGQIVSIYKAGADYVRLTIPSLKDTENLKEIMGELRNKKCTVPVIADIHFNPQIADISAALAEKVRINPGNYIDKRNTAGVANSDWPDNLEKDTLRKKLTHLLEICKKHNTALRIGTNHGSLSERIVDRYGDTPEGMAESAMEFLRICADTGFTNLVVSMKASNTRIMVYATRLLVKMMENENMHFPLHLGVTEAGEGEDGRIKSAVGIGAVLVDGIGDTIRVSLTEDPEKEIPVAMKLAQFALHRKDHRVILPFNKIPINPYAYTKRRSEEVSGVGGRNLPVVIGVVKDKVTRKNLEKLGWILTGGKNWKFSETPADIVACDSWPENLPLPGDKYVTVSLKNNRAGKHNTNLIPYLWWNGNQDRNFLNNGPKFLHIFAADMTYKNIEYLLGNNNVILVLNTDNSNGYADLRAAVFRLMNAGINNPVIFRLIVNEKAKEDFQLRAAVELGGLFIDGLGDGIWLEDTGELDASEILSTAYGILQASRVRMSKTEYISCPSCGRTLFDIQADTKKIRARTAHLKGLKIGIMGCIVNGPGEMADADYGYIGSGKGKVTLYKGKEIIKKNIPDIDAVDELVRLIKENGDWIEPQSP